MIENKMYTKKIELNDYVRNLFEIPDDYEQYVHINFITSDFYFYLHDGSYADPYVYKNALTNPNIDNSKTDEYTTIILLLFTKYNNEFKEAREYRKKHPEIKLAKWFTEAQEELANQDESLFDKDLEEMFGTPVEINTSINEDTDEYYILPFSMNEDAYTQLYDACKNVLMNHPNWIEENRGYGYEHMPVEYKNSWFYIDNPSNNNVSITVDSPVNNEATNNDEGKMSNPAATVNVKSILTIGFMSDKLVFNIRFIMVGGKQLTQPSDVDMIMPFVQPENDANNSDSTMSNTIDSTNDDNAIMQVCEQITSKLEGFIIGIEQTIL